MPHSYDFFLHHWSTHTTWYGCLCFVSATIIAIAYGSLFSIFHRFTVTQHIMKQRENNFSEIYIGHIVGFSVNVSYIVHATIRCLGILKQSNTKQTRELVSMINNENFKQTKKTDWSSFLPCHFQYSLTIRKCVCVFVYFRTMRNRWWQHIFWWIPLFWIPYLLLHKT